MGDKSAPGKAPAKGHASGKSASGSGGCGSGAGGFKPGNTCGHGGNRNQKVEAARAAHTAAKNDVLKQVKAHRAASKAAAKAGEATPAPKELHAAIKKASAAHVELHAARTAHRENKRVERNAAARERRAVSSGRAQRLTDKAKAPAREGQARASSTDKGSPADRLKILAARHDLAHKALSARGTAETHAANARHAMSGIPTHHVDHPTVRGFHAKADALKRRADSHRKAAEKLRESIHDPAKSDAAARTLKSLAGNPVGGRANADAIRNTTGKLTHAELKSAAEKAGVGDGGARDRHELRDHLLKTVGKAKEATPPSAPSKPMSFKETLGHAPSRPSREERSARVLAKAKEKLEIAKDQTGADGPKFLNRKHPENRARQAIQIKRARAIEAKLDPSIAAKVAEGKARAERRSKPQLRLNLTGDHASSPPAGASVPPAVARAIEGSRDKKKSDTKSISSVDNESGSGINQSGKTEGGTSRSKERNLKTLITPLESRPKYRHFTPEHHEAIDKASTRGKRVSTAQGGMVTGMVSGGLSRDETIFRAAKLAKTKGKNVYVSPTYNGWAIGHDRPPGSHYVVTRSGVRQMTDDPAVPSRASRVKKLIEQRKNG